MSTDKRPHSPDPAGNGITSGSNDVAKTDTGMDCLGCRMTGLAFGVGGGGYVMSSLLQSPPPSGAHRAAVLVTAGTMLCFGMYRAIF
jgi:hypothetical protein